MSTPVTYSPLRIDFGGVVPATVGPDISTFDGSLPNFRGGVEFASIPVGATVTVAVSGDTDRFAVRDVFVLEWVWDYPDTGGDRRPPGHGGPPPHRPPPVWMLEVRSQSDGSQPVRVEAGQTLLVRVQYSSLDRDGLFGGSLSVTGDTWEPVEVPLTLFLTDISTVPLETLNIALGNKASLPCVVRSLAGPPTHVSYRMSVTQLHNGLSMTPYDVIDLRAGESRPISIEFQAAVDAPLGANDVAIDQITYFPHGLFVQVNIVPPLIVVNPAQPNTLRANGRRTVVRIAVFVGLSNGPATGVRFTMTSAPPGLSMQPSGFDIEHDQVIELSVDVEDLAPDDGDFTIGWTGVQGTQSGEMTFHLYIPQPISFSGEIDSGGLAALGGWYRLTIDPDGSTRWQGHAHDSGLDGYDFAVSAIVRAPRSGTCVAFMHQGHVGGTVTSGSRDHDWDETTPLGGTSLVGHMSDTLFDDLAQARHADSHVEYTSDIGEAVGSALSWLAKFAVGTVAGPIVGAVIFVAVEAWSFCVTGSLIPGARIAEGILWLAGPENTLFALVAEEMANLGSQSRELTQEEYDWANGMADGQAQTFAGCLPPRQDLLVTDMFGMDGRAFTFPRYDGKTMLNLGPAGYVDPRYCLVDAQHNNGRGDVFVHELVHACQIQHVTLLSMAGNAVDNMLCAAAAGDANAPYYYGIASDDYTTLNHEQQAMIVQDWYAGHKSGMRQQTGIPRDTASPFFHYITDNLRVGVF